MKSFLIILLALLIGAGGGFFAWKYLGKKQESSTSGPHQTAKITAETYNEPFMWGITMRPSAFGRYINQIWLKQIKVTKELDVKWVRIGWSHDATDEFAYHDEVFNYLKEYGLEIYLVIEPSDVFEKVKNPYRDGYDNGYKIASHYQGQIKYYQIMNEAGSNAIKSPSYSGENESDYDSEKYQRTKEWIRGAVEGVSKADPSAYKVITSQWLQTAFLEKLAKDNINYDIIGWDWFSDMGFMGDKKLDNGTLLIEKLKSFDKPLILAEINQRPEGENGQEGQPLSLQAQFIERMANWSVSADLKGFFVLELFDVTNSGKGYTDYYGLVRASKSSSGTGIPGEPRPAYSSYQKIISQYTQ